ncbi:MAG: hemerythrin domain-containing protein [Firmicutes bacterium]|nr:hemerythrin domain-containing protein [Bacillota bacterium]
MARRNEGLIPLSQQHHRALVAGKSLRDAARDPSDAGALRRAAEEFLAFWREDGAAHFRREEDLLLPFYGRWGEANDPRVVRMLVEHVELRTRVQQLEEALAAGREPEAGFLADLGRRMSDHVRLEEDEVFPLIEATVPGERLAELAPFF